MVVFLVFHPGSCQQSVGLRSQYRGAGGLEYLDVKISFSFMDDYPPLKTNMMENHNFSIGDNYIFKWLVLNHCHVSFQGAYLKQTTTES